ncbi:CPBP family intramembrane metalloprotease [Ignatzschineria rhizosphaerae]|uniref:CPBP family intramembrane metalloprotease n=1 Tax=Ignatzschineria rhizosphaerae TaxID=2923279 RepID=A0ABY3X3C6_9GAMM|nr:CPBP family intramembrane glutamic endopeptidase [Ignatzschineria rhizosphaerae]UNM96400.1 CPBP family intramembrane metalloprotease [Ignatzschineria rhizosphaerae]
MMMQTVNSSLLTKLFNFFRQYTLKIIAFSLFLLLILIPNFSISLLYRLGDLQLASLQSGLYLIIICFIYVQYKKALIRNYRLEYDRQKINGKIVLFLLIVGFLFYLIDAVFKDILQLETPENQVILETAVSYFPLTMSIAIVLGMPIIEELIFRGIFFNYFFTKDTLSQKAIGVIVNALLFGFAHELALTLNLLPYVLEIGGLFTLQC